MSNFIDKRECVISDADVMKLCEWVRGRLLLEKRQVFSLDTPLFALPGVDSMFYAELLAYVMELRGISTEMLKLNSDMFSTLRTLVEACA